MSGVVGLWHRTGAPVSPSILSDMLQTLAHRGPDGAGVWREGPVGLGCQLSRVTPESAAERQPCVHPTGAVLVWDGRLDNREELFAQPGVPDPEVVLATYAAQGERFVERLNGDFAFGLFDPAAPRLLLARDPIGVRPLYYYASDRVVVFASEIKALLKYPGLGRRPNDAQVAAYLLKAPAGVEETLFAGIAAVAPGGMVMVTASGLVKWRYWDFDPHRRIRGQSPEEFQEILRGLFAQAVRRRLRSARPVAVSVSGGIDSSAILGMGLTLARRGDAACPDLVGMSFTTDDGGPADERALLHALERALGICVHRAPLTTAGLLDRARRSVRFTESPRLDCVGASVAPPFLPTLRARGVKVVLSGEGGDDLLDSTGYLVDLIRRGAFGALLSHARQMPRWMLDTDIRAWEFLRQAFRTLLRDVAPAPARALARRARIRRPHSWYTRRFLSAAEAAAGNAPAPRAASAHARWLYERLRGQNLVWFLEWDNKVAAMHGVERAYPFLDRDLVAFLMAIPGELVNRQGVPKGLFRRAMAGILPEAIAQRRWKGDFTQIVNANVAADCAQLAQWFTQDSRVVQEGYADQSRLTGGLRRLQGQVLGPTCEVAWRLAELAGLELWLKQWFSTTKEEEHSNDPTPEIPSSEAAVSSATPGGVWEAVTADRHEARQKS